MAAKGDDRSSGMTASYRDRAPSPRLPSTASMRWPIRESGHNAGHNVTRRLRLDEQEISYARRRLIRHLSERQCHS
jgi:hypothetical protein